MPNKVTISNTSNIVTVNQGSSSIIEITTQGPQGPAGASGITPSEIVTGKQ